MKTQYFYPQRLLASFAALVALSCAKTNFIPADLGQEATSITSPGKVVNSTEIVASGNKEVDFLLVLDDSNSMLPELKKLSSRMATFVKFLEASQIDWQMCVTTTRSPNFGKYLEWKNYTPPAGVPAYVLKKGATGLNTIFPSTINSVSIGGGDSGDERAIKSSYVSFQNGGPCYRPGAAVSVIAISDEDERSVGGDSKNLKSKEKPSSFLPLENEDLPMNLKARAQDSFGVEVRFTFNSIIVKPGDKQCEATQDVDVSPCHPGVLYSMMSGLTEGGVGSICDADYSSNLNTFKDKIVNSLNQLTLQCDPVKETLRVSVNQNLVSDFKLEKRLLKFGKDLPEGTRIDLTYECHEE
ncbi:MAG TPA: hypothetical protein VIG33_09785 [Pseudobdellovibrionaceae bacterium]